MNDALKRELLRLARAFIACRFEHGRPDKPDDPELQEKRGVFVTLHKHGELRGCIGFIQGYKSIVDSVAEMAQSAAFDDPRFPPVRKGELDDLQIEISI
ncbi:MAG: AmmeMemoRadiSam system protein A, partial [Candidatus Syntrophosphaera sp.]